VAHRCKEASRNCVSTGCGGNEFDRSLYDGASLGRFHSEQLQNSLSDENAEPAGTRNGTLRCGEHDVDHILAHPVLDVSQEGFHSNLGDGSKGSSDCDTVAQGNSPSVSFARGKPESFIVVGSQIPFHSVLLETNLAYLYGVLSFKFLLDLG
jgi:hypothetical protein